MERPIDFLTLTASNSGRFLGGKSGIKVAQITEKIVKICKNMNFGSSSCNEMCLFVADCKGLVNRPYLLYNYLLYSNETSYLVYVFRIPKFLE